MKRIARTLAPLVAVTILFSCTQLLSHSGDSASPSAKGSVTVVVPRVSQAFQAALKGGGAQSKALAALAPGGKALLSATSAVVKVFSPGADTGSAAPIKSWTIDLSAVAIDDAGASSSPLELPVATGYQVVVEVTNSLDSGSDALTPELRGTATFNIAKNVDTPVQVTCTPINAYPLDTAGTKGAAVSLSPYTINGSRVITAVGGERWYRVQATSPSTAFIALPEGASTAVPFIAVFSSAGAMLNAAFAASAAQLELVQATTSGATYYVALADIEGGSNPADNALTLRAEQRGLSSDNSISSLMVDGVVLTPSGSTYACNVVSTTSAATIAISIASGASATINSIQTTNLEVDLGAVGFTTPVAIVVTAQDGTQASYTVQVSRIYSTRLSGITVASYGLSPAFSPSITTYTVTVPANTTQVVVGATVEDTASTIKIAEVTAASVTVVLDAGTRSTRYIDVTAPDSSTTRYTLNIDKALQTGSAIDSLSVNGETLYPTGSTYTYTVSPSATSVTFGLAISAGASATMNGQPQSSTIALGDPNTTTSVTIVVTAENPVYSSTYTLNIFRPVSTDNSLSALSASGIPFSFSPGTSTYTPFVPNGLTSTTISAATNDVTASYAMTIDGSGASSTLTLSKGTHTVSVEVTAQDGSKRTYTITLVVGDSNLTVTVD